jgi:DNA-binding CsgD family transcriptional regulator
VAARRRKPYRGLDPKREREVLALVGQGLNNDEIGIELFVSPATAHTHVSHAMAKLGARDRAQLVVIAYQTGLVSPNKPGTPPIPRADPERRRPPGWHAEARPGRRL